MFVDDFNVNTHLLKYTCLKLESKCIFQSPTLKRSNISKFWQYNSKYQLTLTKMINPENT